MHMADWVMHGWRWRIARMHSIQALILEEQRTVERILLRMVRLERLEPTSKRIEERPSYSRQARRTIGSSKC